MSCPICYSDIDKDDSFIILNCKCPTIYHNKCITQWLCTNKSCPTCRKEWKTLDTRRVSHLKHSTAEISTTEYNINRRIFLESIGINTYTYNY